MDDLWASLKWWEMVTTIIERESQEHQAVFRLRLQGVDLLGTARRVNAQYGTKFTRDRIRAIEDKITRRIKELMTLPSK